MTSRRSAWWKFDFLGLTTLTILDWTFAFHQAPRSGSAHRAGPAALDDAASYRIFASANTTAVFQFESRGMRDLLKQARPDRFEDIHRAGRVVPARSDGAHSRFIQRKHGKNSAFPIRASRRFWPRPTASWFIRNRSCRWRRSSVAYSLGGADLLRRAMGKKKAKRWRSNRSIFREGAGKNGLTPFRRTRSST